MEYVDLFSTLQDSVPPWHSNEIKAIVTQSLGRSQGLSFNDVFEDFDDDPLGSASIGQVHAATLAERYFNTHKSSYTGGRQVAVKVMHRDAKDRFRNDFKIFKWLCRVALPGWKPILVELERQMMTEFDYLNEASNLRVARRHILESPYRNRVVIPERFDSLCSSNVLVMELLDGEKLASAVEHKLTAILDGDQELARDVIKVKRQGT